MTIAALENKLIELKERRDTTCQKKRPQKERYNPGRRGNCGFSEKKNDWPEG